MQIGRLEVESSKQIKHLCATIRRVTVLSPNACFVTTFSGHPHKFAQEIRLPLGAFHADEGAQRRPARLAYTVNDECEAERLKALGIDGRITDRVDLFSPAP